MKINTLLSIGECMIELTEAGPGLLRQGFAGDSFNTAYYARQALPAAWDVQYFTALGIDQSSEDMLAFMASHGVGTQHVTRVLDRVPGLYRVHLDHGERSFSYWRSHSAAKRLAANRDLLRQAISESEIIFFSGITLAIIDENDRGTLLAELGRAKQAGRVIAFDPNIRPRLWNDLAAMRAQITEAARCSTVVMPSFDDEAAYCDDASPEATIERYRAFGIDHVVVKNGAAGAKVFFQGGEFSVPAVAAKTIVDTTSAGDSFNGTYLAKWMCGGSPFIVASLAAKVASFVIGEAGAIVQVDPSLFS